jgi:glycosyltransferase involved in cell wall biosynthesis
MRILLLSFYYTPDIGPGPLRAKSIIDSLLVESGKSGVKNVRIDVLTTMPNRYKSLTADALSFELSASVTIRRFSLPLHQSGMADQARAFVAFARAVLRQSRGVNYDIVIATSSRLMTAVLGAWVARNSKARLFLDIRDLFTDTMEDVLAKSLLRGLMPGFRWLERWAFRTADKINLVSAGFLPHVRAVAPAIQPSVFTNGIDNVFFERDFDRGSVNKIPVVLYAGNMGEGQGLHHIVPSIAQLLGAGICLRLVGDGGRRKALEEALNDLRVTNVRLLDPVSREDLLKQYRNADVLFLHLNDYLAFHKVLPSKIFEYAATGKPILAGVAGHAADFLREQVPGVEVFPPCDTVAMEAGLQRLLAGPRVIDRKAFCERYRRDTIMNNMAKEILSLKSERK